MKKVRHLGPRALEKALGQRSPINQMKTLIPKKDRQLKHTHVITIDFSHRKKKRHNVWQLLKLVMEKEVILSRDDAGFFLSFSLLIFKESYEC